MRLPKVFDFLISKNVFVGEEKRQTVGKYPLNLFKMDEQKQ